MNGESIRLSDVRDEYSIEEKIAETVSKYEERSLCICQKCGSVNAKLRKEKPYFSWITVLCDDCAKKRIEKINERMKNHEY